MKRSMLLLLSGLFLNLYSQAQQPIKQNMKMKSDSYSNEAQWLQELCRFGRIPNNVFSREEILNNVRYLESLLTRENFRVEIWDTPSGRPYVYAELLTSRSLPTILFYSHFDGVPVDKQWWNSDPYAPVFKDSRGQPADIRTVLAQPENFRLYGRSVADSRNAIISLLAALNALRLDNTPPGVNIKLLLDGEEENESPFLRETVLNHRNKMKADLMISASGETHQSGLPTVAFGVRGMLMLDITLHTAASDMHSGHFGNFTPNAALELAQLLASFKDREGNVVVPGFYEGIPSLSDKEIQAMRAVPQIEDDLKNQFGIRKTEREGTLQDLINQPTFNIRGLQAGYVGAKASNIIPAKAEASIDVRLVTGMDPSRIFNAVREHITRQGFHVSESDPSVEDLRTYGPTVVLNRKGYFNAIKTDMTAALAARVLSNIQRGTSEPWVIEPSEGGSLNFEVFKDLGMPLITLPVSNFDCNQHTHNENLRIDYFLRGIEIFTELLKFR